MNSTVLTHEFITSVPEVLEEGTLYVSFDYATAVHKCCCGCGREVVTPLSPTDWKLTYDGVSVSLSPSIGNWSFDCQSHYWIARNRVRWAEQWSSERIQLGRTHDRRLKQMHIKAGEQIPVNVPTGREPRSGILSKLWNWISR